MKIRNSFVSNSSSSSFIIAYDKNMFGDIDKFFKSNYLGDSTKIYNECENDKFYCWDDDDKIDFTEKINVAKNNGFNICYLRIDDEYLPLIDLIDQINNVNGGNKIEFILDGRDL